MGLVSVGDYARVWSVLEQCIRTFNVARKPEEESFKKRTIVQAVTKMEYIDYQQATLTLYTSKIFAI